MRPHTCRPLPPTAAIASLHVNERKRNVLGERFFGRDEQSDQLVPDGSRLTFAVEFEEAVLGSAGILAQQECWRRYYGVNLRRVGKAGML